MAEKRIPHSDNVSNDEHSHCWGRRKWAAARAEVTADEEASKGSKYSEGCFWFLNLAHTSVLDRFPLRLPNPH